MYNIGLSYSKSISLSKSSHLVATLTGLGISYGDQTDITVEQPILLLPGQSVYQLPIESSFIINKVYVYSNNEWLFTTNYQLSSGNITFSSRLQYPVILFPVVVLETLLDTTIGSIIVPLTLEREIPSLYTDITIRVNKLYKSDISYEFSTSADGPWSVELYSHKYYSKLYMRVSAPLISSSLVIIPCDLLELSCLVS